MAPVSIFIYLCAYLSLHIKTYILPACWSFVRYGWYIVCSDCCDVASRVYWLGQWD